jgi:integrase
MAHIRRHPEAPGRWQVRYVDPTGRERSRNFGRRADAERFLHGVEADMARGRWIDPEAGRIRFDEWNRQVQDGRAHLAPSTRASDGSVIRSLILPDFGSVPLARIEPAHIRAWVAELIDQGYAPSTIRRAYTLLNMALDLAVDEGRIARSPGRRVSLPRIVHEEKRFLTAAQVAELAAAIEPRYRVLVLTGAYTGLRPGELAALRIERLDLTHRQLRVEEPLKTPTSRRTVTYPPSLAEELAHHLAAHPSIDGRVFSAPEGGPIHLGSWRRRHWYPAVEATVGRPMRPHDLRHTHAALLIAAGEDPYLISRRLGHASIRTTYDVYGHLFAGRDRQAADRLEQLARQVATERSHTRDRHRGTGLQL